MCVYVLGYIPLKRDFQTDLCGTFTGQCSQKHHQWERQGHQGKRDKLSCNAPATEASADPMG